MPSEKISNEELRRISRSEMMYDGIARELLAARETLEAARAVIRSLKHHSYPLRGEVLYADLISYLDEYLAKYHKEGRDGE